MITIKPLIDHKEIDSFHSVFKQLVWDEFPMYSEELKIFLTSHPRGITPQTLHYLLDVGCIILQAFDGPALVGILIADNPYAGVSLCSWLIVSRSYQRQGVGTRLVAEWERLSLERGAHAVRLETMVSAAPYYVKLGLTLIGIDLQGYCCVDKYIFKKKLKEIAYKNVAAVGDN